MTRERATIQIDGRDVDVQTGELLGNVLRRTGAHISQVCHHQALGPIRSCDTCVVDVDGEPQRACALPVHAGMRVDTTTERVRLAREEAMHRVLANHELYCTICDNNNGNCEVHNAAELSGIKHQKYDYTPKAYAVDASNPFYRYDPNQCILCGRCVEACQNLQVNETLSIDWSAERPRVLWDGGRAINESSCVSCGHCVTVCPCNALMEKSMLGKAGNLTSISGLLRKQSIALVKAAEKVTGFGPLFGVSKVDAAVRERTVKRTKTVCTYCGVGCSFEVWTKGRDVLKVEPNIAAPANGISTCVKGKFGWSFVNSADRLKQPLVREGGQLVEVSWDRALDTVAARLSAIAKEHGPDSVGFISSSKTTNEECYLVQKLARAVFGTNNVDNCARYCQSPASKGLSRTVGYGADAGTLRDIEQAELVLIVGSNTATSHPVLAAHIKRQHKLHQQKLIVSDLVEHELAQHADTFLRPKPGTDLIWLNAVARYIVEQGWQARQYIEDRVNHFADYKASLEPFTLDYAARETGISAQTLREVAHAIAHAQSVCGLWAMGVTQHSGGTDTCTAISNLLLLTGNFGKPGSGGYPLRGHNNVQGACDFGALYNYLPGYTEVSDDVGRARFEQAWGGSLPSHPGLNNKTMIDAIETGKLKALYVVGEELSLVDANINRVQEALEKLELFVVQDIFLSTTAELADVVLAAAPSLEKDGTFTNTERRIQRIHKAFEPLAQARPDWQILTDLAGRLGHHWGYAHPSEIMAEIAACTPVFAGVRYDRLEGFASLCWPVDEDGTDTPLLYRERFPFPDGKAMFHPVGFTRPHEHPDTEYDLHLNNGRVLEQFHEGNMTARVEGVRAKVPGAYVEVPTSLARARSLADGDWVRLSSRHGSLKTRVFVSERVRDGELYMPLCSSDERLNLLTSSHADPVVDTPTYKEVAVKLEKLGSRGPSPIPRTNPRFGARTPRAGVEVEQKWRRPDYRFVTETRPRGGRV